MKKKRQKMIKSKVYNDKDEIVNSDKKYSK